MTGYIDPIGANFIIHIRHTDIEISLVDLAISGSALLLLYFLFVKKSGFDEDVHYKKLKRQTSTEGNDNAPYQPKEVHIPVVKGWMLKVYRGIARSFLLRRFLTEMTRTQCEFDSFRQLVLIDPPTFYPIVSYENGDSKAGTILLEPLIKPSERSKRFNFNTISDFYNAYKNGTTTPLQVAQNVINCIEDTIEKNLRIIVGMEQCHKEDILKEAEDSTLRWSKQKPLSVFDGIPVAVKDETFLAEYVCRGGFPANSRDRVSTLDDEGWMVSKLRRGGAIFIGVSNMHQLGIGVTGINCSSFHGTARNPYNIQYPPGGSSSGSAAAVASGLCPIALGSDGGGSIRIPASVCGIVGAKNTFARISGTGLRPAANTVCHPGPLCATVQDARISYGYLAGPDLNFELGIDQPAPCLTNDPLKKDIVIGIDWDYFNDSDDEIRECCKAALDHVVANYGMRVVSISIPEIMESMRAHCITILTEMYSYAQEEYEIHHDDMNVETELFLRLAKTFTSSDYFKAQQQRTRIINIMKRTFKKVDCIVTPTCGDYEPKLDAAILKHGCLDMQRMGGIMRYAGLSNFTGHPAISVPVGYSATTKLPIGIQIQTPWWSEDVMLKLADAFATFVDLQKPEVYYDVLHGTDNNNDNSSTGSSCSNKNGKQLLDSGEGEQ